MRDRSTSWCAILALLTASLFGIAQPPSAAAQPASAAARASASESVPSAETAMVVLIGTAGRNPELASVLSELLERQDVRAELVSEPRFDQSALLDADPRDPRVWVFVALDGRQRARLYFRGPFGERFLLRELALRDGLDEVGRELIARVVETSTVALRRSHEGLSRAEAEADLARATPLAADEPDAVAQPATPAAEPDAQLDQRPPADPTDRTQPDAGSRSDRPERSWLLGVRVLVQSSGADLGLRLGAGIEAGLVLLRAPGPLLRARIAFEPSLPQALDDDALDASVLSWPLRLGLDLGFASGAHRALIAVSTGLDIVRVAADRASDPSLSLNDPELYALPASRLELRYELALGRVRLSLAGLLDVPWSRTRYELIADGEHMRIATPSRLRPGIALGCALEL